MSGEVAPLPYLEAYLASSSSSGGIASSRGRFGAGARYYGNDSQDHSCWACAGNHESYACELKRCFKCAETGHESKDCPSKLYCRNCQCSGHEKSSECWRSQYLQGFDMRDQSKVTCMRCGKTGHVSCKPESQREAQPPPPPPRNLRDDRHPHNSRSNDHYQRPSHNHPQNQQHSVSAHQHSRDTPTDYRDNRDTRDPRDYRDSSRNNSSGPTYRREHQNNNNHPYRR